MNLAELVSRLDSYFHLDRYATDDFALIVEMSHDAGIPIQDFATESFLRRYNGLMLDNGDQVRRVFTLVFPSDDVLSEVVRQASGEPALIFTHHPMDMETSGRGIIPIGVDWLRRLCGAGISLYAAHAPLDCHDATSTSRALARVIGVPVQNTFASYFGGHAGILGHIDPIPITEFHERVRVACSVDRLDTRTEHDRVQHVAVVAGGAAFPGLMQEALDAGCDTYVTGDFRVRHGGPWADEHRPQFDAFIETVPLNLIGASHYATEALVLRDDMVSFFGDLGLAAQFVPQADPWR